MSMMVWYTLICTTNVVYSDCTRRNDSWQGLPYCTLYCKKNNLMDNSDWFEHTDWFDDNDWLLGGFLLIDLESNCARIIDSRDCMMTKNREGEIVIPFSLLNVEPEGMSR